MKHHVYVTKDYTVTRRVVVEVDAENEEAARQAVLRNDVDLPSYDDKRWVSLNITLQDTKAECIDKSSADYHKRQDAKLI